MRNLSISFLIHAHQNSSPFINIARSISFNNIFMSKNRFFNLFSSAFYIHRTSFSFHSLRSTYLSSLYTPIEIKDAQYDNNNFFSTVSIANANLVSIHQCIFCKCKNTYTYGGGLSIRVDTGNTNITNCHFDKCYSYAGGGGAYILSHTAQMTNLCFTSCSTSPETSFQALLLITYNKAQINHLTVSKCSYHDKMGFSRSAGFTSMLFGSRITFFNSSNNVVKDHGSAFFCQQTDCLLISYTHIKNCTGAHDKAIYCGTGAKDTKFVHTSICGNYGDSIVAIQHRSKVDFKYGYMTQNINKNLAELITNAVVIFYNFTFDYFPQSISGVTIERFHFDSSATTKILTANPNPCFLFATDPIPESPIIAFLKSLEKSLPLVLTILFLLCVIVILIIISKSRNENSETKELFYTDEYFSQILSSESSVSINFV